MTNPPSAPRSDPVRVTDLGELLAGLPVLFGFRPERSLIVVGLDGGRVGFRLRADLPSVRIGPADADYLVDAMCRNGARRVLVIACSDDPAAADPTVRLVLARMRAAGFEVVDAVRCDAGRYWSYLCDDPVCCPPEGREYDAASGRLIAEAVFEGQEIAPSRASLAARVGPVVGADRERMVAACEAVEDRLGESTDLVQLIREVRVIVDRATADPEYGLSDAEAATLSVGCAFGPIRDAALSWITCSDAPDQLRVWSQVARKAVPPYEVGVLALAGFSAWLSGDGALAVCAVERADKIDPADDLLQLLRGVLIEAIPPSAWRWPGTVTDVDDEREEVDELE